MDVEATQAIAEAEQAQWQAHRTLTVQLPQALALAAAEVVSAAHALEGAETARAWPSTTVSPRKKTA